jgi:AcrR family transcriptional regulator
VITDRRCLDDIPARQYDGSPGLGLGQHDGRLAVTGSGKALRADGQRNRTRVLEVTEAAFATEGLAVPIQEIARRAGVSTGTVSRHFPTKASLVDLSAILVGALAMQAHAGGSAPSAHLVDVACDALRTHR